MARVLSPHTVIIGVKSLHFFLFKIFQMKQFFLTACMGVLFFIGLTSMASAPPSSDWGCQEGCAYMIGAGLFSSTGACMSACHTCTAPGNGDAYAVCMCKIMKEQNQLEPLGWNFGQCVTAVKR